LPAAIRFEQVTRRFANYTAIEGVDLEVLPGSFVAVVGPSGCGKSTLLNIAAGLLEASSGSVTILGQPLRGLNRLAAYMFQQDALLPWKTVIENVALGLRLRGADSRSAEAAAHQWIDRTGLAAFANAYPSQLSGGMKKRAAMAQCWVTDPSILLMDEPFSALDIHTRLRMESELLDLWTASPKTVLFVTHDLEEALAMADQVVVLSAGPASRIVASHAVDLPRPRDLLNIRTTSRFADLHRLIWSELREEVVRSYERTA
jgi:NitT/TauT family transport system ATP-binding protein